MRPVAERKEIHYIHEVLGLAIDIVAAICQCHGLKEHMREHSSWEMTLGIF